jgi:hypothetical protein
MRNRTIDDLFQPAPTGWGLRGDPVLWQEMRAVLAGRPLPASARELRELLEQSFAVLTGHRIGTTDRSLKITAYKKSAGGMSNGMVSPEFWRETAIPLIEQRFLRETNSNDDN